MPAGSASAGECIDDAGIQGSGTMFQLSMGVILGGSFVQVKCTSVHVNHGVVKDSARLGMR